jgi:hypothetical protein
MESVMLAWSSRWWSHAHVFGIGDGPPPLPGFDRLIFAPQPSFEATVTLGPFFITFLLFVLARNMVSMLRTALL